MSREQAEFIRAYAERVLAMPLEERAAYLAAEKERLDALGYAHARKAAATARVGDFGARESDDDAPPADVWGETLAAQIRRAG